MLLGALSTQFQISHISFQYLCTSFYLATYFLKQLNRHKSLVFSLISLFPPPLMNQSENDASSSTTFESMILLLVHSANIFFKKDWSMPCTFYSLIFLCIHSPFSSILLSKSHTYSDHIRSFLNSKYWHFFFHFQTLHQFLYFCICPVPGVFTVKSPSVA